MGQNSPYRITLLICFVLIFGLSSIAAFPALLPHFQIQWELSYASAGWISAAYYAGYMIFVPVLSSITDRIDARKIMISGAIMAGLAALGFAFFATGFWSAMSLRFLAGISLAGIYMPGLKLVSDYTEGAGQSRFISFYTASFSVGASISYLLAGEINNIAGWRWAFAASAVSAVIALAIIVLYVPAGRVHKSEKKVLLSDFKIVMKSRQVMVYVAGYALHMWELFSFRTWIVAFLAFSINMQQADSFTWSPTQVAFAINLIGLPASIGGNELSRKFGRKKVISIIMILSVGFGSVFGFTASLPYITVMLLALLYGIVITADSASLTAGAVAAAPEGLRGTTLAVHSTIGFGAALLGPLAVGIVLDTFGGNLFAWGMGFITMAAGCLLGPVFFHYPGKEKKQNI